MAPFTLKQLLFVIFVTSLKYRTRERGRANVYSIVLPVNTYKIGILIETKRIEWSYRVENSTNEFITLESRARGQHENERHTHQINECENNVTCAHCQGI